MEDEKKDELLSEQEAEKRSKEVLARLLSTPPDPKTKREPSAEHKKRGRPKKSKEQT